MTRDGVCACVFSRGEQRHRALSGSETRELWVRIPSQPRKFRAGGRTPLPLIYSGPLYNKRMDADYSPMDLSNSTGVEEHSEIKDVEGTDVKDMRLEAEAVVNDVLFAVGNMFVSKSLPCAEDVAYINVETRERNKYCLELTEAGLRVVGYAFDQVDDNIQNPYHETVYSLLDSISPAYREAFGNALLQRLEALKRDGQS